VNDERAAARVRRLLARVADQLERHAEGDVLALDGLVTALQDPNLSDDDLAAAAWVLRSLEYASWNFVSAAPEPDGDVAAPTGPAQRVPSAEERETLGPDAWGYLLGLRGSGALDAEQFERVVDLLAGSGVHPVSLALARDVAASVVLNLDPEASGEIPHGDLDVAH
jgi:hypothetical protein